MGSQLDPQVSSALINAGGGFVTGLITSLGAVWARARRRAGRDQRCERICANMVSMADTLVAVIKAIGADDPRLAPHIAQMQVKIDEARTWLNEAGSE